MHEELRVLYEEDQADRRANQLTPDVLERDRAHRRRAVELLDAGVVQTGEDFFHAAMIFQHGDTLEDFLRAHELAQRAAELGHRRGGWLAAAAHDRWLMYQGRPQKYGTQYRGVGDVWELYQVDPETTDAERAEWDVPPLAEAQRRAEEMTARRPPRRPDGAGLLTAIETLTTHRAGDFEVRVIRMPSGPPPPLPPLQPLEAGDPVPWLPSGLVAGRLEQGFGAAGREAEPAIAWRRAEPTLVVGWREEDGPLPEPEVVEAAGCTAVCWPGAAGWTLVAISRPDGQRWMVFGTRPREDLLRVAESLLGE